MSSTRVEKLLEANAKFAETWSMPVTMAQMREGFSEPILVRKSSPQLFRPVLFSFLSFSSLRPVPVHRISS